MLKKATLAVAALAVAAAFLGAGSASAALLYKTTAKTSLVTVGSTFTVAQPAWNPEKEIPTAEQTWMQTRQGPTNYCYNSSITFKVTQNNGTFKAVPTAANFPKTFCANLEMKWANLEIAPWQELSVTGSSTANGTQTAWLGTKFDFAWSLPQVGEAWGAHFTGATGSPPAKGVFVQQPTVAKAPVSFNLANAPFTVNPGGSPPGTVSAKFIFSGEAAAWSFG